ncbi:MAG: hypothetical protein FWJ62_02270 [Thermaerobacter sp.]|nr:hypothetical protein [Bacillota bacterium]REJ38426.1 MAG: hypothetical protein DIU84_00035 [Bacillota bacterium]
MRFAVVTTNLQPWVQSLQKQGAAAVLAGAPARPAGDIRLLVRWGTRRGADPAGIPVINRRPALRLLETSDSARRLELAGLGPASRLWALEQPGSRLLRVEVFDLRPLAVRWLVREGDRWQVRSARSLPNRTIRRAASGAVRALHALGLDAGRVDVAVLPPRDGVMRERVCAVNPAPQWPAMMAEHVAAAVRRRVAGTPPDRWMLGADPEFAFVDPEDERIIPASRFLDLKGEVGCDAQTVPGRHQEHLLAEVRPRPHNDPRALTGALYRCLEQAAARCDTGRLAWRAGSLWGRRVGLGGHIHITGGPLSGALLRALDNYLAVPLLLVEDPQRARRRRRRHGFLGDVRFKDHGGFEYRTPSSWLVSPRLALAVLALAAWILRDSQYLNRDLFLDTAAMEAFYLCDKEPFYAAFDQLLEDLEATPHRDRYLPLVEPLFDLIARRDVWDDRLDLRVAWRLTGRMRASTLKKLIQT